MLVGKPELKENRRSLSLLMEVSEFLAALSTDWRDLLREKYPNCAVENFVCSVSVHWKSYFF